MCLTITTVFGFFGRFSPEQPKTRKIAKIPVKIYFSFLRSLIGNIMFYIWRIQKQREQDGYAIDFVRVSAAG